MNTAFELARKAELARRPAVMDKLIEERIRRAADYGETKISFFKGTTYEDRWRYEIFQRIKSNKDYYESQGLVVEESNCYIDISWEAPCR